MKFRVETKKNKFEPVEITITLDTIDDAKTLWARLNLSPQDILNSNMRDGFDRLMPEKMSSTSPLFDAVDDIVESHLRKERYI